MKLNLILTLLATAGVVAAEVMKTPEQLRGQLKRSLRNLQECSGDACSGGGGDSTDNSGGDNGGDSTDGSSDPVTDTTCFSSFNDVEVQGQGTISMDAVKVGDYVRTGNDSFSRVFSLAHLDHDVEADFLQIYAEGLQKPLEITGMHMLFSAGTAVRADEVSVGDMLGKNKVTEIKSIKRNGVYAPITESGDIVVSGIHASSYYAFLDHIPFNQHVMSHFFFASHRMMCSFDFKLCENEGHTNGYTNWAYWAIKLMEKANEFVAPAQCFLAVLALPFISAAYGLEQMLIAPFTTLAVLGFMAYKKKQTVSKA